MILKKKTTAFILAGIMALSIYSCGSKALPESANTEEGINEETQTSEETMTGMPESEADEQGTEAAESEADEDFSFADLTNLQFRFASGAGGWSTLLSIRADGSFSGEYYDGEMGSTGDDYPNGTMYRCDFKGQFTQPVRLNEYTYSMQIAELNYVKEAGTEEIIDGVRYCYSDVYGLDGARDILIYLPGAPLAELPEEFRSWVGYYDLSGTSDTELPFYALNNEVQQYGFSSYNIVDSLKANMTYMETEAASLEASIQKDALTQTEYNEKTKELYDLWDSALNEVWDVLKQTQDEETMSRLTAEEREWIAMKEQAAVEAGAEYEGGSMQPMAVNQKAAELTKERVYELLKLLGIESPEG